MSDLLSRLERMLHRETHAARLEHRDRMALPVEDRVERGESLADLAFAGEEEGRIRLRCGENLAKFRPGEPLRLGNGDDDPELARRHPGIAVTYLSFDDRTGTLVVERDRWRPQGSFDPALPLQLDGVDGSLNELALEAIARVRKRADAAARAVLERTAPVTREGVSTIPTALDPSQREAYAHAIGSSPVALVQGPPGSGKTWLLAHVVVALARGGERVLVTAHTHRAVNQALRKIAELAPEIEVFKAGRETGFDDLRRTRVRPAASMRRLPPEGNAPRVVGTTLFALRSCWDGAPFDRVVFDEAAQVPLAYAPCAMLCAPRYLFVGDHRQLGPIVVGDHEDPVAEVSVFEHLAETYAPVPLRTTYRMSSGINAFPSKTFYDGGLTPSAQAGARLFPAVPGGDYDAIFDPAVPAVLVEVAHEGHRTRCDAEARVVSALASDLLGRQGFDPRELAIVSPYRAQLRAIRARLRLEVDGPLPVIDTVERIQGQERECVIVSLAASDPDWLAGEQAEFFYSPNRLNVTLTRARTKLVIVASPEAFRAFPHDLDGLVRADRFRALRAELPRVTLTPSPRTAPRDPRG